MPVAIKDNIVTRGLETTCASRILLGWRPPYNATVVERLLAAGAIIVGKTNMDEFAMGSASRYSHFGPVANPHDPSKAPGGSSGGSAAAVAAGMVPLALGSDTGGSIRQPAAWCGVFGLKPTYGRVSRWGLVAFASSLDQIGPLGLSVEDLATALWVMAGADGKDSTVAPVDAPPWPEMLQRWQDFKPRVGVPKEYTQGIHPEVKRALEEAAEALARAGAVVEEISLPHTEYGVAAYQVISAAEASANLARYDGVRYGVRADAQDLDEMYIRTRGQGFGEEVRRRVVAGTFVLSSGYKDAYYERALRVRRLVYEDFVEAFRHHQLLLTPTAPTLPLGISEELRDPTQLYLMDALTSPSSLAGLPAISVPVAKHIGLQLIAPAFREDLLFLGARLLWELVGYNLTTWRW